MGIAHKSKPIFGVQWHPESICSSHGSHIIDNFKIVIQQFWSSTLERKHKFSQRSQTPNKVTLPALSVGSHSNAGNAPHFNTDGAQKAYSVKAVDLGEGPTPEAVFDTLIRSSKNDGEAWLDSAKVGYPDSQRDLILMEMSSHETSTRDIRTLPKAPFQWRIRQ
jgi:para-aminobenzoate synthetase